MSICENRRAARGPLQNQSRDFVRTGLVLTVIAFALVMLLGTTYWHGLPPQRGDRVNGAVCRGA
jgi:hypothetical protein